MGCKTRNKENQNKTNQSRFLRRRSEREKREIRFQNQTLLLLIKRNLRSARVKTINRAMCDIKVLLHSPSVSPLSPFYGNPRTFPLERVFKCVTRSE